MSAPKLLACAHNGRTLANVVFNQFFPQFLKAAGFKRFFFFAGVNIILAVFVLFIVPETRNIALEEMDTLLAVSTTLRREERFCRSEDPRHAHPGDLSHIHQVDTDDIHNAPHRC